MYKRINKKNLFDFLFTLNFESLLFFLRFRFLLSLFLIFCIFEQLILFFKGLFEENIYSSMIMHFLDFLRMESLDISGLVFEPSEIISNQMDLIAAYTSGQHYSFMVSIFSEGFYLFCVALAACEHQYI